MGPRTRLARQQQRRPCNTVAVQHAKGVAAPFWTGAPSALPARHGRCDHCDQGSKPWQQGGRRDGFRVGRRQRARHVRRRPGVRRHPDLRVEARGRLWRLGWGALRRWPSSRRSSGSGAARIRCPERSRRSRSDRSSSPRTSSVRANRRPGDRNSHRRRHAMAIQGRSRIVTHLWYAREAEEAARYYASIFPDSRVERVTPLMSGSPSGPPGSREGRELHDPRPALSGHQRRTSP